MIDAGEAKNAAALARRYGVTRAKISQTLSLLRLAPEILAYIDGLEGTEGCLHLTARRLRDLAVLDDHDEQRRRFRALLSSSSATSPEATDRPDALREGGQSSPAGGTGHRDVET